MMTNTTRNVLKVAYTLLVIAFVLVWVMQHSLNAYWGQTYHRQSPISALSEWAIWQQGGQLHEQLKTGIAQVNKLVPYDFVLNPTAVADNKQHIVMQKSPKATLAVEIPLTASLPTATPVSKAPMENLGKGLGEKPKKTQKNNPEKIIAALPSTKNTDAQALPVLLEIIPIELTALPVTAIEKTPSKQPTVNQEITVENTSLNPQTVSQERLVKNIPSALELPTFTPRSSLHFELAKNDIQPPQALQTSPLLIAKTTGLSDESKTITAKQKIKNKPSPQTTTSDSKKNVNGQAKTAPVIILASLDEQATAIPTGKSKKQTTAIDKQNTTAITLTAKQDKPPTVTEKTTQKSKSQTAKIVAKKTSKAVTKPQINRQQQVFFAGDSLMQGVAPHVRHSLRKKYGINSIDLSKQSTGLAYSSFFDWHKTIKEQLNKHKNIALIVVFLGPNDPWDMPNPKGGKYLRFQSQAWEQLYRKKIRQIIETAKQKKVQMIWLGVPDMRKKKLNKGVRYLNTLYQSEAQKAGILYLPTQFLLTGKTAGYSKFLSTEQGKKIAVRTNDGIHFTRAGQKRIAQRILQTITVTDEN